MFKEILENAKKKTPLVHCITNYVTVNDCANILLACGGSPIMADDINEVEEITSICTALYINIGTLNERTISSMMLAGKKANQLAHPVVLDPVGIGASKLRTDTTISLMQNIKFSVIRGNISEIKAINNDSVKIQGVDANIDDAISEENIDLIVSYVKNISKRTNCVIAVTGAIDIVADENKAYIIRNGNPLMSKVSGTGCMLTAIITAFCGANPDNILDATACAVVCMGLSGELAHKLVVENHAGTSSYRTYMIDEMSKMNYDTLKRGIKIEIK